MTSIGFCFHRDAAAADVVTQARRAEALGFDEFWVIEDCFFTSGVALAAAALTATETIGVGIGIVPAVARNPAVTAMDFATLAALGGGRFHGGIGHGVQEWMGQMGAQVASPLTVLDETISAVRALLAGERVTVDGRYVTLDDVALDPPPATPPLVSAGVRGPKSLALSGRVGDGTIMADFVSADYVRWARTQIDAQPHRITVLASMAIAPTADGQVEALEGLGYFLAEVAADAPISLRMAPFYEQLAAGGSPQALTAEQWSTVAAAGSPDNAASYVASLAEAGVDAVCFFPNPFDPLGDAELFAETVLPLL